MQNALDNTLAVFSISPSSEDPAQLPCCRQFTGPRERPEQSLQWNKCLTWKRRSTDAVCLASQRHVLLNRTDVVQQRALIVHVDDRPELGNQLRFGPDVSCN